MRSLLIFVASFVLFGLGGLLLQSSSRLALGLMALAAIVFLVGLVINHGEHTRRR
jgi:hypothetical protein